MNMSACVLGNAVRVARKDKHLSQEALAERIGVCKRTIIDIENSVGNPKFEILYPLVRELDLPLQELENCSDYEMKIILNVVRSLKYSLKEKFNEGI